MRGKPRHGNCHALSDLRSPASPVLARGGLCKQPVPEWRMIPRSIPVSDSVLEAPSKSRARATSLHASSRELSYYVRPCSAPSGAGARWTMQAARARAAGRACSRYGAAALDGLDLFGLSRLNRSIALANGEFHHVAFPPLRLEEQVGASLLVPDLLTVDLQQEVAHTDTSLEAQSTLLPA
jgi:hypothetical protein